MKHKQIWIVLLGLLFLTNQAGQCGVKMEFRGYLWNYIRISGTEELHGKTSFDMRSSITAKKGPMTGTLTYQINNFRRYFTENQANNELRPLYPQLKVDAPLFYGRQNVSTRLGLVPFAYSPYVAWLDDQAFNDAKYGIAVDKVTVGPFLTSGFFVFDSDWYGDFNIGGSGVQTDTRDNNIAYGGQCLFNLGSNNVKAIYVQYLDRYRNPGLNISYGDPSVDERTFFLEISNNFGPFSLTASAGDWNNTLRKHDGAGEVQKTVNKKATMQLYNLQWAFAPGVNAWLRWRDFQPNYDPIYANQLPLFYNNEYRGGNPLDKNRGQRGVELGVKFTSGANSLEVKRDEYIDHLQPGLNFNKSIIQLRVPNIGGGELRLRYRNIDTHYLNQAHSQLVSSVNWSRQVSYLRKVSFASVPLDQTFAIIQKGNASSLQKLSQQIGIAGTVPNGLLKGFSLGATVEHCSVNKSEGYKWRGQLSGRYNIPGGLYLKFEKSIPSVTQKLPIEQRWDEDFRELLEEDDYLEIGLRASF
jgi:hypothetical protein